MDRLKNDTFMLFIDQHKSHIPTEIMSLMNHKFISFIINNIYLDLAKIPRLCNRKLVHIDLILIHLRSHNRGSFYAGPNEGHL